MSSPSDRTRLIASATRRGSGRRPVNPPLERASTMLSDRAEAMRDDADGPVYGLDGMTAARELRAALAGLDGAEGAFIVPSGLAAVTVPVLALTRRLIALRRETPALRFGRMTVLKATGPQLVFRRDHGGRSLICAFNLGEAALDWPVPEGRLITGVNCGQVRAGHLPPLAGQILDLSS